MLNVYLEQVKGDDPGSSVTLKKGTTKVGRKEGDIVFNSKRVSSVHAEFHFSGTRVFVQDRNSTNGTYVNDMRIERTALKDGDLISFGATGDKASMIYRLHIIREIPKRRVIFVSRPGISIPPKFFLVLLIVPIIFLIWFFIPVEDEKAEIEDYNEKPWEITEELLPVSAASGVQVTLALGDTVLLPAGSQWMTEVRYEKTGDSGNFEDRLYIVDLWNQSGASDYSSELVRGTVTLQRFVSDFEGSYQQEAMDNFKWHETVFLRENSIGKKFIYSKTEMAVWQWVIWEAGNKFNLYATCITARGRILLQGSAFDIYVLKRFFQYVAGSYLEGQSY
ncbi:MAG: FHA domain-containing protein [Oligoflexia bacterium]|nr:FHA domain-containing protein [Oligoflexia bacterium]